MAIRGKEEKLGDVIDQLVGKYRLRAKLDEVQLHQWWDEILGPELTRYTEALYLNGSRILVHISASAVRQELSFAKNKLISDINKRYGQDRITDIVFI